MHVQKLSVAETGLFAAEDGRDLTEPHLVLVFGPTDALKTSRAAGDLSARFPEAIVVGCSTGSSVLGRRVSDEAVVAMAVTFRATRLKLSVRPFASSAQSAEAGRQAGLELAAPDLAGVFVLSDGLTVNGTALVEGLRSACGPDVVISGGLAGDGARFGETLLQVGGQTLSGAIAAIGFYGDAIRIGTGGAGGWDEFGPLRRVTRSEGAVLHELDGSPALDLYERYLGEEAGQLPASALFYPLKIWDPARPEDAVVRTVLGVDHAARTMTFAGDIPEGWSARLMRGMSAHLIASGSQAAGQAMERLGEDQAALCLYVSCVGRRLVLGQKTEDELDAVADALGPNTALAGFYSYGEISPHHRTGACDLHNQTLTLTLMTEAA